MNVLSRRSLARWAADELVSGAANATVAERLAAVLIATGRVAQAGMLADDVAYELERSGRQASATLTSRYHLSSALLTDIEHAIRTATGTATVHVRQTVDESVLGGIRISTATRTWDLTTAHQLNELRKAL